MSLQIASVKINFSLRARERRRKNLSRLAIQADKKSRKTEKKANNLSHKGYHINKEINSLLGSSWSANVCISSLSTLFSREEEGRRRRRETKKRRKTVKRKHALVLRKSFNVCESIWVELSSAHFSSASFSSHLPLTLSPNLLGSCMTILIEIIERTPRIS